MKIEEGKHSLVHNDYDRALSGQKWIVRGYCREIYLVFKNGAKKRIYVIRNYIHNRNRILSNYRIEYIYDC